MKKLIVICVLLLVGIGRIHSQEDRFRPYVGMTLGLIPLNLTGTMDLGDGSETLSSSTIRTTAPEFRYVDTTIHSILFSVSGGLHIPLVKKDSWSFGFNLNAGLGVTRGINGEGGLNWLVFSFPEYLYFRKSVKNIHVIPMVGWQHTLVGLRYGMPSARLDIEFAEDVTLGFYTGLYRPTYYQQYTNGDLVPALRISEFGIVFTSSL